MGGRTGYRFSPDMDWSLTAISLDVPQVVGSCLAYALRRSSGTVGRRRLLMPPTPTVTPISLFSAGNSVSDDGGVYL
jgi:hypothetical protein